MKSKKTYIPSQRKIEITYLFNGRKTWNIKVIDLPVCSGMIPYIDQS
jgi:hypothetical protein